MIKIANGLLLVGICFSTVHAANWPTNRGDPARTGDSAETLPAKLSRACTYHPVHSPTLAWPHDDRMLFDRAPEVVVANGLMFFDSQVDCQVVALDAVTGRERWQQWFALVLMARWTNR